MMKTKIMALQLVGIAVIAFVGGCQKTPSNSVVLSQLQLIGAFQSNWITRAQIIYDPRSAYLHEVRGHLRYPDGAVDVQFVAKVRLTEKLESHMLTSGRFEVKELR